MNIWGSYNLSKDTYNGVSIIPIDKNASRIRI